jgi:acyl dehydratase
MLSFFSVCELIRSGASVYITDGTFPRTFYLGTDLQASFRVVEKFEISTGKTFILLSK